jgi:hypothetical protein
MIKNIVRLESIINEKVGHLLLENDCPIEVAEHMLLEFLQYLGKLKEQAKAQAAQYAPDIKPEIPQPEIANV